jgi:hypothetical protein
MNSVTYTKQRMRADREMPLKTIVALDPVTLSITREL